MGAQQILTLPTESGDDYYVQNIFLLKRYFYDSVFWRERTGFKVQHVLFLK